MLYPTCDAHLDPPDVACLETRRLAGWLHLAWTVGWPLVLATVAVVLPLTCVRRRERRRVEQLINQLGEAEDAADAATRALRVQRLKALLLRRGHRGHGGREHGGGGGAAAASGGSTSAAAEGHWGGGAEPKKAEVVVEEDAVELVHGVVEQDAGAAVAVVGVEEAVAESKAESGGLAVVDVGEEDEEEEEEDSYEAFEAMARGGARLARPD